MKSSDVPKQLERFKSFNNLMDTCIDAGKGNIELVSMFGACMIKRVTVKVFSKTRYVVVLLAPMNRDMTLYICAVIL